MDILKICVVGTFLIFLQFWVNFDIVHACSSVCTCTTIPAKSADGENVDSGDADAVAVEDDSELPQTPRGKKVNCSNNPYPIISIEDINRATTIPLDTIKLDLSKNAISVIHKGSFNRLSDLQRLDLSSNQIVQIEPGAFEGLHNLRRLNLSNNRLGSINSSMFAGLHNLQRLMLSDNRLNTIPEGTFNDLPALRKIDFKSDYLRCDCHLQWIVKWAKDKKVKISASTKCAVQKELNGTSLKKLKQKDLHCNRPLQLKLFEILPGKSQIVFEGDKLPLQCQAKIIDKQFRMFWLREGAVVQTNRSAGVFVLTRRSPDNTIMLHSLVLENLKSPHRGLWQCMVSTPQGNVTKSVNIMVIESDAVYCKEVTTKTNKGVYIWKATVAGVAKSQPCRMGKGMVTHFCDKSGHWDNLNRSSCDFTNELTRRLQGLASKVNTNSTKIINDAKTLERIVSAPFEDGKEWFATVNPEYVDLASLVIYRLSRHVAIAEDIVSSVLYSASKVMNISTSILFDAQRQRKSCSRIFRAIEDIPKQVKDKKQYSQSSDLIVMESRSFPRQHFPGVRCGRLDLKLDKTIHRMILNNPGYVFVCSTPVKNDSDISFTNSKPLTSVTVPQSAIVVETSNSTSDDSDANRDITFQFIWYKNSNLFPVVIDQHLDPVLRGKKWNVISNVISPSFSEPVTNLTEPIELVFEIPETDKRLVPVYWDVDAYGGFGDWKTDGCSIVEKWSTLVTVHCYHLMPIAVLEDQSSVQVNMFRMMQAVVYIGSCICLICLMAVIITYVSCFRFLNVPKKMKHSVINICISTLLIIIGFTMGVRRTDHVTACQLVGIALHYLTLVTLFWFTITASNMLKKFMKVEKPPPPPVDMPMPLPAKPMIRFYLLAWGVPSIVCGITAAVSFEFYSQPEYCFLEWEPGLGALVGPSGFLVLINIFYVLRISCVIRGSSGALNSLEDTQELPITDIELTPSDSRIETRSINSNGSTKSSVSSVMDSERRPITQLRAFVAILLIFLVMWLTGAFAVAKPFESVIPYQELVFSYLYGVFSAVFGLFMLIYYCLARKDSQTSWKRFFLCESNNIYDTNRGVPNLMPQSNGHVHTGSGSDVSNSNKVGSTTVILNHVNHIKNKDDELSNLNLFPSKPPSEMDESVNTSAHENMANSFYNPRQNAVATKFWEKKNKHNSKLFSREMVKTMNIGSGDESNISGSDRPSRPTLGYVSDGSHANSSRGNPMLNMEMQVQNNDIVAERLVAKSPTSPGLPPSYSSVLSNNANNIPLYPMSQARLGSPICGVMSPGRVASPLTRAMSPARVASPLTRAMSPECVVTTGRAMTPVGGQNCSIGPYTPLPVPQHMSSPSEPLPTLNHFSAFAVVPPRYNSLPRQGKPVSAPSSPERDFPVSEQDSVEPGSVTRLGDFDGQSQVSSAYSHERQRSPLPSDLQYMSQSGYSSPPDGYNIGGPVFKQYGLIDGQPANGVYNPPSQPHRNRANSGGHSSDNSRNRRKLENSFVQQVEQRIPQGVPANHIGKPPRPPISPVSDSDNNSRVNCPDSDGQIHYRKYRLNDSDHNSEPASKSSRKHSRSGDQNKQSKSKSRGLKKQRSLDWDDEFKNRPPTKNAVPYAYVNHNYTDRVMQKLTNKAINENLSPKSKAFWIPRSSSSYNEIVQDETSHLCEDSSTSSSDDDDSLDNIWVRRKSRKEKNKKETSV